MVASLFGITFIASAGVGLVYQVTKEPIAQAAEAATREALTKVLPAFDQTTMESTTIDDLPVDVYTAKSSGGDVVGYAIKSMTKQGFAGVIEIMIGFTPEGEVVNVNVLSQSETPGLGTLMTEDGNPLLLSIQGKRLSDVDLRVKKDGGDVDALTAATISSRAYIDAVSRAFKAYKNETKGGGHNE